MILIAATAAVVAVFSIASFFGRWVWWLDVLSNFRAQYVVALAVPALMLMLARWRRTAGVVSLVAVANLLPVLPLYLGSPGASEPSAPAIRVMSFNLFSDNQSFSQVVEYIETVDPDLVLLHEASRPWEVAMESADLGYDLISGRGPDLVFGTLVLLRGEEIDAVTYGFAETQPRAVHLGYRPTGWPEGIDVLSVHPLAPTDERRAALRDAQMKFAAEWARGREGPVVIVGDLNASPWSWPFRDLIARTGLRNSQIGYGLDPSFPATANVLLRVPIDHLLHSDELVIRSRALGPAMGSDHFPLVVDLELAP